MRARDMLLSNIFALTTNRQDARAVGLQHPLPLARLVFIHVHQRLSVHRCSNFEPTWRLLSRQVGKCDEW